MFKSLKLNIEYPEKHIKKILSQDNQILNNYKIVTSIKSIGLSVACQLIHPTDNYTRFENWRTFRFIVAQPHSSMSQALASIVEKNVII